MMLLYALCLHTDGQHDFWGKKALPCLHALVEALGLSNLLPVKPAVMVPQLLCLHIHHFQYCWASLEVEEDDSPWAFEGEL